MKSEKTVKTIIETFIIQCQTVNEIKNKIHSKVKKIMQENNTSAMPSKEDIDQAQFEADKRAVYK